MSRDYIYNKMPANSIITPRSNKPPLPPNSIRNGPRVDEQTEFTKTAAEQNVLFKRDLDNFYDQDKETAENFVRNYNEFFAG